MTDQTRREQEDNHSARDPFNHLTTDTQHTRENGDPQEPLEPSSQSIQKQGKIFAERDIATAGGGNIPGVINGPPSGTGSSTSDESNDWTDKREGASLPQERGNQHSSGVNTGSHDVNTIDRQAAGNLGGRNPGQPQTAMGDQDSTRNNRPGESIVDPMTSRAPEKVNQQQEKP